MPQLSDLRESGAIEQDADMVMFLYRPEYYGLDKSPEGEPIPGETWINIAKHRNGKTDVVKVRANLEFQKFEDMPQVNEFGITTPHVAEPKASVGIKGSYGDGPKISVDSSIAIRSTKFDEYDVDDNELKARPENNANEEDEIPF
jgi:replicative DNA helicase